MYALDAITGTVIWHTKIDIEPTPMHSGAPLIANGFVYVPMTTWEIRLAANFLYGCCTTSGGMAALDVQTGELVWYRPTIEEEAKKVDSHWFFVDKYAPSGAPVWGAPTYDKTTNTLFFGTGQNYTLPATDTSDAIFALNGDTGEVKWVSQLTSNDTYNIACDISYDHPNCPDPVGPDVDFGAPPVLVTTADGQKRLFAGQKSSDIHSLNPSTGKVV